MSSETSNSIPTSQGNLPFAERAPSQNWESVLLPGNPPQPVWVWWKPGHSPQAAVVRIPDEAWQASGSAPVWTVRQLAFAAGIDPASVASWQVYGMAFHGLNGTNPVIDQPLPAPPPGASAEVLISVAMPAMNFAPQPMLLPMNFAPMNPMPLAAMPMVGMGAPALDSDATSLLDRLDTEWNSVIEIEKDLERLRKMLVDLSSRLKILNRDLSSDERLYSSREDKQDWQDCRRFLRDGENRLRACVKEYDIGDPSSAGYRRSLEMMYLQFVQPKIPFPGMEQALGNFEAHRKLVMTLQGKMNTAYLGAVQNGERRAQQVLARIAGKVREAGTKKTALGVVLDG